ncbi:hypothetical protein ABIB42_000836 [Massilia sp. UYP32]|jgi:hypothetical protein|uniref:Uncharacterized protein n=1 Tax=Massilia timonae CCUG 45783 TaxID=883126 RepID=K9DEA8_9BURK|nr:hypothetical protein [Massilia timonae]EKU82583.1 hypothetical protein HMPREF9710_02210 [Massilia timonae CCUG 45783]HAK93078.1 hypothetical protein [Massilia timonae]
MRTPAVLVLTILFLQGCTQRSVEEQSRAFGNDEFTPKAWAAADRLGRGRMLASFLRQHPVKELSADQVRALLGQSTGYADYDENLAYFVGPSNVESEYGKGYLLIFVTDKKTGRIQQLRLVPSVEE